MENDGKNKRTFTEEFEVAGSQLVEKVKALLEEGNVRQLIIKAQDGDVYLETPLTLGVIAGGAVVLAAPWLAILGAIAALVARVKIEVVREEDDEAGTGPTDAGGKPISDAATGGASGAADTGPGPTDAGGKPIND